MILCREIREQIHMIRKQEDEMWREMIEYKRYNEEKDDVYDWDEYYTDEDTECF